MKVSGEVYTALPLGRSWAVVRVRPGGGYVTIGELPLPADAVVRWDEDGRLWALNREGGTLTGYALDGGDSMVATGWYVSTLEDPFGWWPRSAECAIHGSRCERGVAR